MIILYYFLSILNNHYRFPDVDKVLLNLEAKDFTVEPSLLQSLQLLIQWVADLALNILAKLPENRAFVTSKTQGVSIFFPFCEYSLCTHIRS